MKKIKYSKSSLEKKNNDIEEVSFSPFQVLISECGGDQERMVDKFVRKCKKNDIFRPIFDRMYFKSKSQKKREAKLKATRLQKKEHKV